MRITILAALAASACVLAPAQAQDAAADYSADEFVRAILSGPQPCPKGMR